MISNMNPFIKTITVVLLTILWPMGSSLWAQNPVHKPEVLFNDAPSLEVYELLMRHVPEVLQAVNQSYTSGKNIREVLPAHLAQGEFGQFGLGELEILTDSTRMFISDEVLTGLIVELRENRFEVRNLYVTLGLEDIVDNQRRQELVLSFTGDGVLFGARFAIPQHRYDEILSNAISLEDQFRRLQIVNYLERFRTAYNRKDIAFIAQQFSENALIITGTRIIEADDAPLRPNETIVSDSQYRLIRRTKEEYINQLQNVVFRNNDFINVEFTDIEIFEHPIYEEVYGINLFQTWESTNYSDTGYLFLMIDYEDENQPKIYVRAWQPTPFEDGSVIDMDMFELIK